MSKIQDMGASIHGFKINDDSSEEDTEAIPSELRAYMPARIDKKKMRIYSYKDMKLNFVQAFVRGALRPND